MKDWNLDTRYKTLENAIEPQQFLTAEKMLNERMRNSNKNTFVCPVPPVNRDGYPQKPWKNLLRYLCMQYL